MEAIDLKYYTPQEGQNPKFQKAFEFLKTQDLAALEEGKTAIDGDDVFANVSEYDTVDPSSKDYEVHKDYFDIQFVVSGEETMYVHPVEGMTQTKDFEGDMAFYKTDEAPAEVPIRAGQFVVVGTDDAHKPGCTHGDSPTHVKKIVVKVKK